MSTIAEAEKAVEFNVFYAKRNVVDSIWKEAIIEGVNITYPQAKVIVEYNQTVEGLTVTGTITVYNLKLAWNYLFEHLNSLVDFEFVAKMCIRDRHKDDLVQTHNPRGLTERRAAATDASRNLSHDQDAPDSPLRDR